MFLGLPFLGIRFGVPDDRVLPPGDPAREVQDVLRTDFASREAGALQVVVASAVADPDARADDIAVYATTLSLIDGVARVDASTGSYVAGAEVASASEVSARFAAADATWLSVVPSVEPLSPAGEDVVHAVRFTQFVQVLSVTRLGPGRLSGNCAAEYFELEILSPRWHTWSAVFDRGAWEAMR